MILQLARHREWADLALVLIGAILGAVGFYVLRRRQLQSQFPTDSGGAHLGPDATPTVSTYINHPVHDRLYFAARRLSDLRTLNHGDLAGASHRERQPLAQEIFFHLCGAIDFLAQEVNSVRKLGLDEEDVSVSSVCQELAKKYPTDPVGPLLSQLHPTTRNKPLPTDPYSEDGSLFRVLLLRNFVSHIRHNPFNFALSLPEGDRSAHLFLDPREPHQPKDQRTPSKREAFDELVGFLELITSKCNRILTELTVL